MKSKDSSDLRVPIKRSSDDGIDNLFGYTAEDVENVSEIEAASNDNLTETYGFYLRDLDDALNGDFKQEVKSVLSPFEINSFIDLMMGHEDHIAFSYCFSLYFNRLIQHSYNAGHNDFKFDFNKIPSLPHLGVALHGTRNKPLKIDILGDVSDNFCQDGVQVKLNIDGNVGNYFGFDSSFICATVSGNVGDYFSHKSHCLSSKIDGNAGNLYGHRSNQLLSYVGGDIKNNIGNYSTNLKLAVGGKFNCKYLGISSSNLTLFTKKDLSWHYTIPKNKTVICGKDAFNDPRYHLMKKELEEKLK
jgi:hypothetical protein